VPAGGDAGGGLPGRLVMVSAGRLQLSLGLLSVDERVGLLAGLAALPGWTDAGWL